MLRRAPSLFAIALAAIFSRSAPAADAPDAKAITALLEQLSDEDFNIRKIAQQKLIDIGAPILPVLADFKISHKPDTETINRLRQVLAHLADRAVVTLSQFGANLVEDNNSHTYTVQLPQKRVPDEIALQLGLLPIRQLSIYKSPFSDAGARALALIEKLEVLNTDDSLPAAALAKFPWLKDLHALASSGVNITDETLAVLEKSTTLESLYAASAPVTDAGVAHIAGIPSLKYLRLGGPGITAKSLELLAKKATVLMELRLDNLSVSDKDLQSLPPMPTLHGLSYTNTKAGDGLVPLILSAKEMMTAIDLSGTAVTDAAFTDFNQLVSLRTLRLRDTAITDAALTALKRVPHLTTLDLTGTKITKAAVPILADFPVLECVILDKTAITQTEFLQLKKARPTIRFRD